MKFSRRTLLTAAFVSAVAPAYSNQAHARFPLGSSPVAPAAPFGGNPNLIVTSSANIGGGVVMSRTGGNCIPAGVVSGSPGSPAFAHVSASGIACTGTWANGSSLPISAPKELEFTWDFGDAASNEIFISPADGVSRNSNTGQTGNEAVHCYRVPGTYPITLTVRASNGAGGFVSKIFTSTFTVIDVSSTFTAYFLDGNPGAGLDTNNGLHPTQGVGANGPKATPQGLSAVLNVATTGTKTVAYIAEGSVWQDAAGAGSGGGIRLTGNNTSIRFTTYMGASGAGANPLIQISDTTNSTLAPINVSLGTSYGTGAPAQDIVFTGINGAVNSVNGVCNVNPMNINSGASDPTGVMYDLYFDNCNFTNTATQSSSGVNAGNASLNNSYCRVYAPLAGDSQRIGCWNCNFSHPVGTMPTGGWGTILGVGVAQWMFVFGGSITGDSTVTSGLQSHSIYAHGGNHQCWRWISTVPLNGSTTTVNQTYAINLEQDLLPGAAHLNTGTSQNASITGATGNPGDPATFSITGNFWPPIRPVAVDMFAFCQTGLNPPPRITGATSASIASITYNSGTNVATLTTTVAHGVTNNFYVWLTLSGNTPSAYNGTVLCKVTGTSTLTFTPLSNPGGNATVVGSFTGITFTVTPNSIQALVNLTNQPHSFGIFNAQYTGTYNHTTFTVTVTPGSTMFGNGQTDINVGDVCFGLNSAGGALNFGIVTSVTGSPVTSFVVNPIWQSLITTSTPTPMFGLTPQLPTVVSSVLIDGCALATTQYAFSGNSSTNNGLSPSPQAFVIYNDYVVQYNALANLQNGGTVASCVNGFTFRFNRTWGVNTMVNGLVDLGIPPGTITATANWAIYGNRGYLGSTQTGEFLNNENVAPSGLMPIQFTDNYLWSDHVNATLAGVNAADNSGSLIDRNYYVATSSASPFKKAVGSSVAFGGVGAWQSFGFDPNGILYTTSAAALAAKFASWTYPPSKWSDFGT